MLNAASVSTPKASQTQQVEEIKSHTQKSENENAIAIYQRTTNKALLNPRSLFDLTYKQNDLAMASLRTIGFIDVQAGGNTSNFGSGMFNPMIERHFLGQLSELQSKIQEEGEMRAFMAQILPDHNFACTDIYRDDHRSRG